MRTLLSLMQDSCLIGGNERNLKSESLGWEARDCWGWASRTEPPCLPFLLWRSCSRSVLVQAGGPNGWCHHVLRGWDFSLVCALPVRQVAHSSECDWRELAPGVGRSCPETGRLSYLHRIKSKQLLLLQSYVFSHKSTFHESVDRWQVLQPWVWVPSVEIRGDLSLRYVWTYHLFESPPFCHLVAGLGLESDLRML